MGKKALLIGNNYINNPPRFLLQGCYTDLEWSEEVLTTKFGFQKSDIRVHRDDDNPRSQGKPTREVFLDALNWLLAGAKAGDILFFHFSGHGIQVPIGEREGFEWEKDVCKELGHDEMANGQQEALCPCDIEWKGGKWCNFISTYEMRRIIRGKVPAGCLLFIVNDCCHSGTMFRDAGNSAILGCRGLPRNLDNDTSGDIDESLGSRGLSGGDDDFEAERSFPDYCILIAGAHSKQTAADAMIDGKKCGALSCYLYAELKANPGIKYMELIKNVKAKLKEKRFTQVPQLDALEDRDDWAVFDVQPLLEEAKAGGGGGGAPAPAFNPAPAATPALKNYQKPQKPMGGANYMDDELDSVIESEMGSYNIGGLSNDLLNMYGSRGLAGPAVPPIPLKDILASSKVKSQLQHLTAHGVATLADVAKLAPKDWQIIKVEVGLRNRLVHSLAVVETCGSKLSQADLTARVSQYVVESNLSILGLM